MLEALANSGIELEVIDLGIITHVVLRNKEMTSRYRRRTAHAQRKRKSKRQFRTMATRSACNRLTDCASLASS